MFVNPAGSGKGYQIANSVRLRSAASAYFSRTFGTPTSANTSTTSFWFKKTSPAGGAGTVIFQAGGTAANNGVWSQWNSTDVVGISTSAGGTLCASSAVVRDPTAWNHFCIVNNAGTWTIYKNNQSIASGSGTCNINQASTAHYIGCAAGSSYFSDGDLAEFHFIDGQALSPSSFGQADPYNPSNWVPKAYTGTYGNNGFYLDFSDGTSATTLGYDRSGNGNNWTASGISTTAGVTYDWLTDTPTNNYCVLNGISELTSGSTFSYANLRVLTPSSGDRSIPGTIFTTAGKWYAEFLVEAVGAAGSAVGIVDPNMPTATSPGLSAASYGYTSDGNKRNNSSTVAYGNSWTNNDVIGVALDLDNGKLWFSKNGVWQASGDPSSGTSAAYTGVTGPLTFAWGDRSSSDTTQCSANFGQRPFTYTPPTGFKTLCTANLPAVAIPNPSQAIAHRYEAGSGIAANIASDRGSWVSWIEIFKRGDTSESWKVRFSSDTSNMWAFDSNAAKAAWSAPSAGTYLGIALRVGSTYGIDTGTYSGNGSASQDVSHSLGVAPTAAIIKDESTGSVYFWHSKMTGATYFTIFNSATPPAQSNTNTPFGGSGWLSSTFGVTNNATNNLNASSHTYRYILFSDVSGLLRMLGFTGNGSTDGAFEYAGQRPQIQIEKDLAATTGIYLFSDMIDTYNVTASYLLMNSSAAVAAATGVDIVANGIKHRSATVVNAANSHAAISLSRQSFGGSNVSPSCAR